MIMTVKIKPESVNDFLGAMKGALPETRAYEGCVKAEVYSPEDEPSKIMFFEVWEKKEDHEKYFNWRVESGMMEQMGPILDGQPETVWLTLHDI